MTAFREACSAVERALEGDLRPATAAEALQSASLGAALRRLAGAMRSHRWTAAGAGFDFAGFVRDGDRRSRAEALHALHDWDGKAGRMNQDSIPVDVLEFIVRLHGDRPPETIVAAILIDYYFLYLLALLSLRSWDDGDADDNLDTLDRLLALLQGPRGSGQPFARSAETLLLIATSHYEPVERGYDLLLERVRTLDRRHQVKVATSHASAIGCHLRFGFEATYGRDTSLMRQDNAADYPWLCFALATLVQEYTRPAADADVAGVVEAMLNGLSADARAFVGEPPECLSACAAERSLFRETFLANRDELLQAFERLRPSEGGYSPLAFFFNFSHNVQKGTVVDALLRGRPWPLALDDMFAARDAGASDADSARSLAVTLMGYARAAPDRIRGRLMPAIVYDPAAGRMAFSVAMQKLRQ